MNIGNDTRDIICKSIFIVLKYIDMKLGRHDYLHKIWPSGLEQLYKPWLYLKMVRIEML